METKGSEANETIILFTTETAKLREAVDEILREQTEKATVGTLDGMLGGHCMRRGQLAVLVGIFKTTEFSRPARTLHPGVQRAMRYLQEHFRDRVSLAALAARSHLSRSHLSHLFKQQTGQSVTAYLAASRIRHAKELLRQDGVSISEVSEDVGFREASQFTRVFRRLEGVAPSMYRQQTRKHKTPKE